MLSLLLATDPGLWASLGLNEGLELNSLSSWCSMSASSSSSIVSMSLSAVGTGPFDFAGCIVEVDLCSARDDGARFIVGLLLLCTATDEGDLMVPTCGDS